MSRDIDEIIQRVIAVVPDAEVSQLQVKHSGADDDGLWFFSVPGVHSNIQIESPLGNCPFIVEHSGMQSSYDAIVCQSVEVVVNEVVAYLLEVK